jgi:hypothetical protein
VTGADEHNAKKECKALRKGGGHGEPRGADALEQAQGVRPMPEAQVAWARERQEARQNAAKECRAEQQRDPVAFRNKKQRLRINRGGLQLRVCRPGHLSLVCLRPDSRGSRISASRLGPSTARTIGRMNGSRGYPTRSARSNTPVHPGVYSVSTVGPDHP